jgi:hypothetical protein
MKTRSVLRSSSLCVIADLPYIHYGCTKTNKLSFNRCSKEKLNLLCPMAYSSWKQRLQKDASYESDPVFVDMLVNLRNTNKF